MCRCHRRRGARLIFTIVRCTEFRCRCKSRPSIVLRRCNLLRHGASQARLCPTVYPIRRYKHAVEQVVEWSIGKKYKLCSDESSATRSRYAGCRCKPARPRVPSSTTSENWSWTRYWRQSIASPHPLARNRPRTEVASSSYSSVVVRSISRVFIANCIFFFVQYLLQVI